MRLELMKPRPARAVLVVYVVSLATTSVPALRASRIRPAEALRYQ
jgi:ABC-type lipoprotein release transport system permease subunit